MLARVAEDAGVSVSTVSRALRGRGDMAPDTRSRVLRSAQTVGYTFAGESRGRPRRGTSSLVFDLVLSHFHGPYTDEVTAGARTAAAQLGYDLVLTAEREDPDVAEPADLDDFWACTLTESRALASAPQARPVATPITQLIVEDLTSSGHGGEPIRAWVARPHSDSPLPTVLEYIGYNGGRGVLGERLQWTAAGYVHVLMGTRGQGSGWGTGGDTPDPHGSDGSVPGFMTRGIRSRETYFGSRGSRSPSPGPVPTAAAPGSGAAPSPRSTPASRVRSRCTPVSDE
ncbi:acetylxylan esterase [Agromyces albus]|uniref:acetylxylan esterase n=1 Tax=Agromyces albus TaxID=205332 RepID=UPI0027801DFC|nr:acetylxylan esterase [Agromyces albus]MDQ0577198.1 hypothetical protein [Agromyces albus]